MIRVILLGILAIVWISGCKFPDIPEHSKQFPNCARAGRIEVVEDGNWSWSVGHDGDAEEVRVSVAEDWLASWFHGTEFPLGIQPILAGLGSYGYIKLTIPHPVGVFMYTQEDGLDEWVYGNKWNYPMGWAANLYKKLTFTQRHNGAEVTYSYGKGFTVDARGYDASLIHSSSGESYPHDIEYGFISHRMMARYWASEVCTMAPEVHTWHPDIPHIYEGWCSLPVIVKEEEYSTTIHPEPVLDLTKPFEVQWDGEEVACFE